MGNIAVILFGVLFTAAVCWALGRILFHRLGIELKRTEHDLLAAVAGASLLSLAVFILCALKSARPPVFLWLGMIPLLVIRRTRHPSDPLPPLPQLWKALFAAAFAFYALLYLSNSLAPEISPDGAAYHLGLVARYFRLHGFERLTTNMYANLSQGMEMLFLFAFAFGRHSAAATVHCCFLFALPLLIVSYARRIGHPAAGVCAATLVYLSPVVGIDGVSAYNDVALATVAFAMFYLLEIWRETKDDRLLIPAGLLAGFCFAIKYTGAIACLYAVVLVLPSVWNRRSRPFIRLAIPMSLMALPWLIKNALWLGNPLSPFFNRLFPNPYIHVSFEDSYRNYFHTYALPSLKPLLWIVTVGGQLGGQIGPLFLLAPLTLLSLRSRPGRHCLLAAVFFLIPYPQNIGARFLIPALPFIALGIALALEMSRATLALLVTAAVILAWPRVIDKYRAPAGGWQIVTMPWQAAVHIIPPDTYLERHLAGYVLAQKMNRAIPAGKRIWSSHPLAESYIAPTVLVNYQSAEGELIEDILLTPLREDTQPLWDLSFTFPRRTLDRLRLVQTATSPSDIWSVGEARFFLGEHEVFPSHADARPNPWDIRLALDHNPVTRWRSWESIHPGMHVDVAFSGPVELDRIELYCSHDQYKIDVRPEGFDAKLEKTDRKPTADLRRLAARTIKARGIDYLLTGSDYLAAPDIERDPQRWGLKPIIEYGGDSLYEIQ
ncbi:MAG: glycosyltransferase family 39 protein [Bryobacteraceae bacterium]|jgi:4-amino-4-deoxy-L-arabinose transferase-like glycosyltransferase